MPLFLVFDVVFQWSSLLLRNTLNVQCKKWRSTWKSWWTFNYFIAVCVYQWRVNSYYLSLLFKINPKIRFWAVLFSTGLIKISHDITIYPTVCWNLFIYFKRIRIICACIFQPTLCYFIPFMNNSFQMETLLRITHTTDRAWWIISMAPTCIERMSSCQIRYTSKQRCNTYIQPAKYGTML